MDDKGVGCFDHMIFFFPCWHQKPHTTIILCHQILATLANNKGGGLLSHHDKIIHERKEGRGMDGWHHLHYLGGGVNCTCWWPPPSSLQNKHYKGITHSPRTSATGDYY